MNKGLKQYAQLHDENIELKKEIERLKGERGWISVKNNKIPEKLEDFLVLFDNGEIRRLLEDDPPFACITHYMPLPEPPKQ